MILVFDLDDTLYDEITYVKSCFNAVADYLSFKFNLSKNEVFNKLVFVLETTGRGSVFNQVLEHYNIFSKSEVRNCLNIYRKHIPDIVLKHEAINCLERFRNVTKYLVTDGNKKVQTIKIRTLKLNLYFKRTLPTHNFGITNAKPSTYVFHKILEWENALPEQLLYVADNPNKDFVNLKVEGFKTLRVLTGMFKDIRCEQAYEADYVIKSLNELDFKLINKIFN